MKGVKKETMAVLAIVLISIVSVLAVYDYLNNQVTRLVDSSYREYKYRYVWHIWQNLNFTIIDLESNDTESALYSIDSALSRLQGFGWVGSVMGQYSTDYNRLSNNETFIQDLSVVRGNLLAVREHIFNNNISESDLVYLLASEDAFLLWSDNLIEPVGNVYRITYIDTILLTFHNLAQLSIPQVSVNNATAIARLFLDSKGDAYKTGILQSLSLEVVEPNFYWHEVFGIPVPDVNGTRLCWVAGFEQAMRPGHFFVAWVDSESGEVIGGMQCH